MAEVAGSIKWLLDLDKKNFDTELASSSKAVGDFQKVLLSAEGASKIFAIGLTAAGAVLGGLVGWATLTAARTETLGVAMEAVARATGNSIPLLKEMETAMFKQGIATQEARTIMTRMMQANLDLAKASDISRVAQDAAVISGKNSSETAEDLIEGIIKLNPLILRTAGITVDLKKANDEYADTLGTTADSLTVSQKQTAAMNAVLQEGEWITGAYAASMETAGKKLTSLDRWVQYAANNLGSVFLPAFNKVVDVATEFLQSVTPERVEKVFKVLNDWAPVIAGIIAGALTPAIWGLVVAMKALTISVLTSPLMMFALIGAFVGLVIKAIADKVGGLTNAMIILSSAVQVVILAFQGLGRVVNAIFTRDFGSIKGIVNDTFSNIKKTISSAQRKITENNKEELDKQAKDFADTNAKKEEEIEKISAKTLKSMREETEKYQEELEKRERSFLRSLADLVWAHQDKVQELKKDLSEENAEYAKSNAERVADFKKSMDNLKKAHEEKTQDIKNRIEEETETFNDRKEELLENANDKLTEETKAYEKKVTEIEALIDKEEAKGKNAMQTKIRLWKEELLEEKAAYEEKVLSINAKVDKEVDKVTKAHDKKIAKLDESLAKEKTSYDLAITEATERDSKETLRLEERHAKRVSDLQSSLEEEQGILSKHYKEVEMVKDQARLNDIERHLRSYAENNAEALKQHQKKLADLRTQGEAEGKASADAFNRGIINASGGAKNAGQVVARNLASGLGAGGGGGSSWGAEGQNAMSNFMNGIRSVVNNSWDWLKNLGRSIGSTISSNINSSGWRLPWLAEGVDNFSGGMAIVGEKGPELVRLPRGADVIPNHIAFGNGERNGGNSQQITINIDKVIERQDFESIGRELGFRANL